MGAILSDSNKSGKGEEEPTVVDGVILGLCYGRMAPRFDEIQKSRYLRGRPVDAGVV